MIEHMSTHPSSLWYWQVIRNIQRTFDTVSSRYAATAASAALFVVVVAVLYSVGGRLKERYDGDTVEAVQSLVVTVTAVLITGFLVAVWRIPDDVLNAFAFLSISPEQGVKALVTFIVLAGGVTVTRLTKRSIKYGAGRFTITPHQREVAHHAIQIVVFIPFVAFVVALWGIPVANLFLGAGVLGIVLGLAARKTLSGILSGFVILFARPFEVGDWIRVADREGIVTDITVYNTQIRTFNEEHVLVPNETVTGNEIVNYSKTDRLRLETDVGVDYGTDVGTAASVAVAAMERVDAVADQPPPDVIRREFADSAVILRLRYWITTPTVQEKWRAQNAVVEAVKGAFEAEGIKIPFPQRELTGREEKTGRAGPSDSGAVTPTGGSSEHGMDTEAVDESITDPPADEDTRE
jgi:small-conductance mechanosensitive channel